MRQRMSQGETHRPLLLYVGRLGAEKNIHLIREVRRDPTETRSRPRGPAALRAAPFRTTPCAGPPSSRGPPHAALLTRQVLERIPEARLAIVGAGPAEPSLRATFKETDTVFMGLMQGEELS